MRTLVLLNKAVFPPIGGAPLRNWQNINGLLRLGPVSVVSQGDGLATVLGPLRLQSFSLPTPLETFGNVLRRGPPIVARRRDDLLWFVRKRQLECLKSEFKPDLVVLAELAWARVLASIAGWKIPIIYDAHNVEATLSVEMPDVGLPLGQWRLRRARASEYDLVSMASQIWVCSESDRRRMTELYACGERITVIPNGVESRLYDETMAQPPELSGSFFNLLYTGDFGYLPNAIAAERLCLRLLPALRKRLGKVRMCFAGRNPTSSMLEHADRDPGIVVTGRVPDIRPYLKSSHCMLVPLESGGGTRLKILEAFAAGCPVVSTPKGAEGLEAESGVHLLLGSTDFELVQRAVEICTREQFAKSLSDNARQLIASAYDWTILHRRLSDAVMRLKLESNDRNPSAQ